jgi:hypothetical protein
VDGHEAGDDDIVRPEGREDVIEVNAEVVVHEM